MFLIGLFFFWSFEAFAIGHPTTNATNAFELELPATPPPTCPPTVDPSEVTVTLHQNHPSQERPASHLKRSGRPGLSISLESEEPDELQGPPLKQQVKPQARPFADPDQTTAPTLSVSWDHLLAWKDKALTLIFQLGAIDSSDEQLEKALKCAKLFQLIKRQNCEPQSGQPLILRNLDIEEIDQLRRDLLVKVILRETERVGEIQHPQVRLYHEEMALRTLLAARNLSYPPLELLKIWIQVLYENEPIDVPADLSALTERYLSLVQARLVRSKGTPNRAPSRVNDQQHSQPFNPLSSSGATLGESLDASNDAHLSSSFVSSCSTSHSLLPLPFKSTIAPTRLARMPLRSHSTHPQPAQARGPLPTD